MVDFDLPITCICKDVWHLAPGREESRAADRHSDRIEPAAVDAHLRAAVAHAGAYLAGDPTENRLRRATAGMLLALAVVLSEGDDVQDDELGPEAA